MRVLHRIRVEGATPTADRLRVYLARCSFTLVPDSTADLTIECKEGPSLMIDCVASLLEQRLEANLEELDRRFKGCGTYIKQRAGGVRTPDILSVTVPLYYADAMAIALLQAIEQATHQSTPTMTPSLRVPRREWWRFWSHDGR